MLSAMFSSNTFGATAIELDFEGLVDKSDAVLVGYVRAVRSEGERKPIKISTVVEIELESCFKGSCPQSLVLKQLGGKFRFGDGWFFQNVPGMPQFQLGEGAFVSRKGSPGSLGCHRYESGEVSG